MPKKRKGAAAKQIPHSYFYSSYGYTSQPSNNLVNNSTTQPEYVYYPVDQNGRIIGQPTKFPPIFNPQYQGSYSYRYYPPSSPIHRSYMHSPRQNSIVYNDYYDTHRYPYSDRSYERTRHENLPPLYRIVFRIICIFIIKQKLLFIL